MPESPPDTATAELGGEQRVAGLPVDAGTVGIAAVEAAPLGAVKRRLSIGTWLAIVWLAALLLAAIFAPILPIPSPNKAVQGGAFAKPFSSASHILGNDAIGRDLLARVIWGARNSLIIGFGAIAIGIVIGGFAGLYAGYHRGKREVVIVGAFDVLLSIPPLVLALALVAVLRDRDKILFVIPFSQLATLVVALGLISIPVLARITRANTLVWSQREFVTAARAQGAKNRRIMFREVLPNVLPAMFSIALLGVAVVIVLESGLSLVGIGLSTRKPTWGNIINGGRSFLTDGTAPHIVFVASAMIFLTVLALNYLGDVVRARFDVREAAI